MIISGTGTNNRLATQRMVNPHPYPNVSTNGLTASGRNVLIRHRSTIMPVIADAANRPKASTTYETRGRYASSSEKPMSAVVIRTNGNGSASSAVQP